MFSTSTLIRGSLVQMAEEFCQKKKKKKDGKLMIQCKIPKGKENDDYTVVCFDFLKHLGSSSA